MLGLHYDNISRNQNKQSRELNGGRDDAMTPAINADTLTQPTRRAQKAPDTQTHAVVDGISRSAMVGELDHGAVFAPTPAVVERKSPSG